MLKSVTEKIMQIALVFLIFLFIGYTNVNADFTNYKDFKYDDFVEANKGYWLQICDSAEDQDKCLDYIIKQQKKFYTQLYRTLASKQKKGLFIDDATIIATVFYEYPLNDFVDTGNTYKIDESDFPDGTEIFGAFDDGDGKDGKYFEEETDSIKLLVNAMIGYERNCYGIDNSYEKTDEEGNTSYYCTKGSLKNDGRCYTTLYSESVTFLEKYSRQLGSFFGIKSSSEKNCEVAANEAGFASFDVNESSSKKVLIDGYWKFLEEGDYFDRKPHLAHYYASVLKHANVDSVNQIDKEKYQDELREVRRKIIDSIKEILENYKAGITNPDYVMVSNNDKYYWPIGSSEITENAGRSFASKDPVSVAIVSNYGIRKSKSGEDEKHTGIDLGGVGNAGETNIIAAKSGTVTAVTSNCFSNSSTDDNCGGGYGNHIIIQHNDGLYTVYAHLHENSITVKEGDSVEQGQIIGKMGSSGNAKSVYLHFEVRTGSSADTATDPLEYINPDDPRPSSLGDLGALLPMLINFEGSGPSNGDNYVVYCNTNDVPTVGPGVTLRDNADDFAAMGYTLSGSAPYENYCGKEIPKVVVDQVFGIEVNKWADYVKSSLASNGLNFSQPQIDALTDLCYNGGYRMDDFISAYSTYGNSQSLCTNWWNDYYTNPPEYKAGLTRRRTAECRLFITGEYSS